MTPLQRRAFLLAPLGAAIIGGGAFWMLLDHLEQGGADDLQGLPSPLIGQQLPRFSLPGLPPHQGFSSTDVVADGHPALINFFASWCIPCALEAPVLSQLKRQGTQIWGIAYRDKPDATVGFLRQNGDPYMRIASDESGTVGGDFGLYGVPETFLIDRSGIVRWRWAGGLSSDIISHYLTPILQRLA